MASLVTIMPMPRYRDPQAGRGNVVNFIPDTCHQVLKATDNVEVTPTPHQGKDASSQQGIKAL